jgi:hypothetical protein
MNKVGIYELFGKNEKVKKLFFEWAKSSEELCQLDEEHLENDLWLPIIDNTPKYIYFHCGNILDFLEENGVYISLELVEDFKWFVKCFYVNSEHPFSTKNLISGRIVAYEDAIKESISFLECKLEESETKTVWFNPRKEIYERILNRK